MDNKALVVGLGEVGRALYKVLLNAHSVWAVDERKPLPEQAAVGGFDFLHICFPYSPEFKRAVNAYQVRYRPAVTVIHSTVPVGTSRTLSACHSPVMGVHPNLETSLTTFTKFVGGEGVSEAARHLGRAGIRCYITEQAETTELLKLLSTTFYGLCIEWTKHVKELCDWADVPFEAWTLWTQAYNAGYAALGRPEFTRPQLVPMSGRIGGHCVLPNLDLMPGGDPFVDLIRGRNE